MEADTGNLGLLAFFWWFAASWPLILGVAWIVFPLKRQRIRERYWFMGVMVLALVELAALIAQYWYPSTPIQSGGVTSYGLLGSRASLPKNLHQGWYMIGIGSTVLAALRSIIGSSFWKVGPRRYWF